MFKKVRPYKTPVPGKSGSEPKSSASCDRAGAQEIRRLKNRAAKQAALILAQKAQLDHSQRIFDRASAAANIGVWQCTLPDERIAWTDVVYDMFDFPRGAPLARGEALKYYTENSARELERQRSRAIAEKTGFSLDAEIVTLKGNRRWIRITATVECEDGAPSCIFGMKQDITEEKLLTDRIRYLAEFDPLTGLANRSQFQRRLAELQESRADFPPFAALLLVDLDDFKRINDTFGHVVGDACICEAAERLKLVFGDAHFVARIGGDEFAIFLGAHLDRQSVVQMARATVRAMNQPAEIQGTRLELNASVGAAMLHDCSPGDVYGKADLALYAAKAAGRGTYSLLPSPEPDCKSGIQAA